MSVASPPPPYHALAIEKTILWEDEEEGRAIIAVAAGREAKITATVEGDSSEKVVKPSEYLRRFAVELSPPDRGRTDALSSGGLL